MPEIMLWNELITKMDYIEIKYQLLIKMYIIKKLLNLKLSRDLFTRSDPDNDIIYLVEFTIGVSKRYIAFCFDFMGKHQCFITYDGNLYYKSHNDPVDD